MFGAAPRRHTSTILVTSTSHSDNTMVGSPGTTVSIGRRVVGLPICHPYYFIPPSSLLLLSPSRFSWRLNMANNVR